MALRLPVHAAPVAPCLLSRASVARLLLVPAHQCPLLAARACARNRSLVLVLLLLHGMTLVFIEVLFLVVLPVVYPLVLLLVLLSVL